jgi:hypothetical protein
VILPNIKLLLRRTGRHERTVNTNQKSKTDGVTTFVCIYACISRAHFGQMRRQLEFGKQFWIWAEVQILG